MSTRKVCLAFAFTGTWNSPDSEVIFGVIAVRYDRGVYLPQHDFWLDPRDAKCFAFVSHAHGDNIAPHRGVVASKHTRPLMQVRLPGLPVGRARALGAKRSVRGAELMILP